MFAPGLLDELLGGGVGTVSLDRASVVFRHLIVQLKLVPLPLFLQTATPEQARTAVLNLGECIKNNAVANIFNKDLDGRNYGVSRILRVYLFDYAAVEPLTDVKVRGGDRNKPASGTPRWSFEQGTVFEPAELISGLRIGEAALREAFRNAYPDLLSADYWEATQRTLREGKVPKLMNYPAARRLHK
jgi:isocitrate dehydrogenase kinase/phosphatase